MQNTPTPQYILFDVDQTLYPASTGMESQQIVGNITRTIAEKLQVNEDLADQVRETWFLRYGSAFEGMYKHLDLPVESIVNHVYERGLDYSAIVPSTALQQLLLELKTKGYKLSALSNGSTRHAERTLAHMGIAQHFELVWGFDMFEGAACKPHPHAFRRMMNAWGCTASELTLVEDSTSNLKTAMNLGIKHKVLIRPKRVDAEFVDAWFETVEDFLLNVPK